jgi:hypothetical protein
MPKRSPRKEILAQLQPFLVLYHTDPRFRHIYHFLPALYALVKSRRYLTVRDVVTKIGKWTESHLDALGDVRATRDVRMSRESLETRRGRAKRQWSYFSVVLSCVGHAVQNCCQLAPRQRVIQPPIKERYGVHFDQSLTFSLASTFHMLKSFQVQFLSVKTRAEADRIWTSNLAI